MIKYSKYYTDITKFVKMNRYYTFIKNILINNPTITISQTRYLGPLSFVI